MQISECNLTPSNFQQQIAEGLRASNFDVVFKYIVKDARLHVIMEVRVPRSEVLVATIVDHIVSVQQPAYVSDLKKCLKQLVVNNDRGVEIMDSIVITNPAYLNSF